MNRPTSRRGTRQRSGRSRPPSSTFGPLSADDVSDRRAIWALATLLLASGLLIYANSFSNPFVLDDDVSIVNNEQIRNLWSMSTVLPARELPTAGRPLVNVSFAINYALHGLNVGGYHAVNITLHLFCSLLLFGVVRRSLRLPKLRPALGQRATAIAFAAALLWMVHPLNSEPVDYLTQRTESMMALCYLLTLYANVRAVARTGAAGAWQVVAVMACVAGMMCKESMVTAPVAILLFDRAFVFDSFKASVRSRRPFYGALAASWAVLAGLLSTGPRRRSAGFSTDVSAWTYLWNQAPMVTRYLRLMLWPRPLVVNYGLPVALTAWAVAPYVVFISILGVLALLAFGWSWPIGFLGAWFFLTLAPTSSIVPIATEVGAERRMYLPSMAFVLLLVLAAMWLLDRLSRAPADRLPRFRPATVLPTVLLLGISSALALTTFARNREYESPLLLARLTLQRYPTPAAHHMLAQLLLHNGNADEAIVHLSEAVPGDLRAYYTMGVALYDSGRLTEAVDAFRIFVREQPSLAQVVEAHGYMGKAFARQERWPEAIGEFREILMIAPATPAAEKSLADALFAEGTLEDAIAHYRAYLESMPADVDALNQLGIALGSTGRNAEAIAVLSRAEGIAPANAAVQRNLGLALWGAQQPAEALRHARLTVQLQPNDADAHQLLGRILAETGSLDEAANEFRRALQIDPQLREAREDLERIVEVRSGPRRSP